MNKLTITAVAAFFLAGLPAVHAADDYGVAAGTRSAAENTGAGELASDLIVGGTAALAIAGTLILANGSDGTNGTSGTTGTTATH